MHKFWSTMARIFAVLFAAFFVISAVPSLILVNIDRRMLNASTYIYVLNRQQAYTRLPQVIAEQLVMSPPMGGGNQEATGPAAFIKDINATDWGNLITALVPPEVLRRNTENLIVQLFAYLNGNQNTVSIAWAPIKNRLNSQAALNGILALIRAQPACSVLQLAQLEGQGTANGSLLCRPPEVVLNLMTPAIRSALDSAVSQIPEQTTILSPASGGNSASSGQPGPAPSAKFRQARLIMLLSPDIPVGFLLLVTLLAVRDLKGLLRWWGIPAFIIGVISLVSAGIVSVSFENIWGEFLAGALPVNLSSGAVSLVHDLVHALLQVLVGSIIIGSTLLVLLGLGLWIGSAFIRTTTNAKQALASPNPIG